MDALLLARIQFGFTVSLHIVYPGLTIGSASYLAMLEGPWLRGCVPGGRSTWTCITSGRRCSPSPSAWASSPDSWWPAALEHEAVDAQPGLGAAAVHLRRQPVDSAGAQVRVVGVIGQVGGVAREPQIAPPALCLLQLFGRGGRQLHARGAHLDNSDERGSWVRFPPRNAVAARRRCIPENPLNVQVRQWFTRRSVRIVDDRRHVPRLSWRLPAHLPRLRHASASIARFFESPVCLAGGIS